MTDVEMAKKNGDEFLKTRLASIKNSFAYEETAYHLPISFALTGIAVHDAKTSLDVFSRMGSNPIVASECILAEKNAVAGKEPAPYTGFISDTVIRKWDTLLSTGASLVLPSWLASPGMLMQERQYAASAGKIHAHVPCR